ncbi:hypothetical protein BJ165DRAFT_909490 [Panaeolus papilionaceus]|nr:hypothetical protein BJ165DRAFT_909490 [Panaeolus papilionaceus]
MEDIDLFFYFIILLLLLLLTFLMAKPYTKYIRLKITWYLTLEQFIPLSSKQRPPSTFTPRPLLKVPESAPTKLDIKFPILRITPVSLPRTSLRCAYRSHLPRAKDFSPSTGYRPTLAQVGP